MIGSGSPTGIAAWSSAFPAGSKTVNAVFWDQVYGHNISPGHAIVAAGHAINDSIIWASNGGVGYGANPGGLESWATFNSGQTTYMIVDMVNSRVWGTLDFTTYYGNGGASPNPATNTNGLDFSGITGGVPGISPGIYLVSDKYGAGTWNAGRTPDTSTLPVGFRWLDPFASLRSRIMMA